MSRENEYNVNLRTYRDSLNSDPKLRMTLDKYFPDVPQAKKSYNSFLNQGHDGSIYSSIDDFNNTTTLTDEDEIELAHLLLLELDIPLNGGRKRHRRTKSRRSRRTKSRRSRRSRRY